MKERKIETVVQCSVRYLANLSYSWRAISDEGKKNFICVCLYLMLAQLNGTSLLSRSFSLSFPNTRHYLLCGVSDVSGTLTLAVVDTPNSRSRSAKINPLTTVRQSVSPCSSNSTHLYFWHNKLHQRVQLRNLFSCLQFNFQF